MKKRASPSTKQTLLNALSRRGRSLYSSAEIRSLLKGESLPYIRNLVLKLEREGRITILEKGKYLFVPEGFQGEWSEDAFYIASKLIQPYAVAFWSSLNYWHYTEQIPRTIFVISSKRKQGKSQRDILGMRFQFVTVPKRKFVGIEEVWIGNRKICMASREKTILDAFDKPQYCGGIMEAVKGLFNAFHDENFIAERLIQYGSKGNRSALKRIGYTSEVLALNVPKGWIEKLRKNISRGYSLFDPLNKKAKGNYNARWQLYVNVASKGFKEWMAS